MKIFRGRLSLWRKGTLLLTVLTLLFILLSFIIKEPSTMPFRYQFIDNTKERLRKMLEEAAPHPPTGEQGTGSHAQWVQKTAALGTTYLRSFGVGRGAEASWEQRAAPRPAEKKQGEQRAPEDSVPQGSQDKGMTAVRTEELGLQIQDRELNRGKGDEKVASVLSPERRGKILSTGALLTRLRERPKTTEAASAKEKATQATPSPAPFLRPTTQRSQRLKAANFKSEPRWDFEEEYSLDVGGLRTTCPDSLKVRASKSPWLHNVFLPNLTLFLDSRHFTQSEWDRLEHFAPPFGFMELNQSLVQKVVTRFPPVLQQQLLLASLPTGDSRCVTCAVVGNGGILNNSHVGQEIDSHDYVFRLSGAITKGYEQDVGTRTSFYGFTAFSLVQSILILGSRGFQHVPLGKDVRYLHFLEATRDYEWLEAMFSNQTLAKTKLSWFRHRPQEAFREALSLDRYLLLHPDFLRYMKNRFLRSKTLDTVHWRIYRPTTGALLLLTALHLCDKVSAYGFITEGHEHFSDHYYDKSWKRLIFYINHDFKLERKVWKQLHDEGIIWLYQRPQTDKAKN